MSEKTEDREDTGYVHEPRDRRTEFETEYRLHTATGGVYHVRYGGSIPDVLVTLGRFPGEVLTAVYRRPRKILNEPAQDTWDTVWERGGPAA